MIVNFNDKEAIITYDGLQIEMQLEEAIKRVAILQKDECQCQECIKNREAYTVLLHRIKEDEEVIEEMGQSIRMLPNEFKSAEEVIEVFRKKVRNG